MKPQCSYTYPGTFLSFERGCCPNPAFVWTTNDFGYENWYCREHAALFAEQEARWARIVAWFKRRVSLST
jgi:hypothetical protein